MVDILKIWKMRYLSLQGKITIFKSLAISKIVTVTSVSPLPQFLIEGLVKIQSEFIWDCKKAKIKHSSLIGNYLEGGLNKLDIRCKIKALHLSWLKRLYDENFHPWKVIPNFLLNEICPSKCLFLSQLQNK